MPVLPGVLSPLKQIKINNLNLPSFTRLCRWLSPDPLVAGPAMQAVWSKFYRPYPRARRWGAAWRRGDCKLQSATCSLQARVKGAQKSTVCSFNSVKAPGPPGTGMYKKAGPRGPPREGNRWAAPRPPYRRRPAAPGRSAELSKTPSIGPNNQAFRV